MALPSYIGGPTVGNLVAASDLSTKQFFVVKISNTGKVALQETANAAGGGVC